MNGNKKIDIVVICYQKTPIMEKCLKSIKKYTENFRLILICNKKSASENRNSGLRKIKSDWFVMLDDDVIVTPGWLDNLLYYRRKDVGQISPKILYPDNRLFAADIKLVKGHPTAVKGFGKKDNSDYNYVKEAELLVGTCSLYNSAILEKCRFDENYKGSQQEDIDFSMQIKAAGYKLLYCGKSHVYHENLKRQSYSDLNLKLFKGKWLPYILQKEHDRNTFFGKFKTLKEKIFDYEK